MSIEAMQFDDGGEWVNASEAPEQTEQQQEPFGYFRPEPFGWTDCAETDEGAIALYEQPPASKPLTDEMEKQKNRHLGPHRQSAFRDGWRSAEAAHGIKGDA